MSRLDALNRQYDRLVDQRAGGDVNAPDFKRERRQLERAIEREEARTKSRAKAARHAGAPL
jgi:hypothetical protein